MKGRISGFDRRRTLLHYQAQSREHIVKLRMRHIVCTNVSHLENDISRQRLQQKEIQQRLPSIRSPSLITYSVKTVLMARKDISTTLRIVEAIAPILNTGPEFPVPSVAFGALGAYWQMLCLVVIAKACDKEMEVRESFCVTVTYAYTVDV